MEVIGGVLFDRSPRSHNFSSRMGSGWYTKLIPVVVIATVVGSVTINGITGRYIHVQRRRLWTVGIIGVVGTVRIGAVLHCCLEFVLVV